VVSNKPSGKPFFEGGDALILDPQYHHVIVCHFVLGGRMVVLSQKILTEKKIDMISSSKGATKPFCATHHSCGNPINAAEMRDPVTRICPGYQKLFELEW
jgi:hypothetical protein